MRATGEAQLVDVSAQSAMTWTMLNAMVASAIQGRDFERAGSEMQLGPSTYRVVFPCADGFVVALGHGGTLSALLPRMREEGVAGQAFADEDWATYEQRRMAGEPVALSREEIEDALLRFYARYTKDELFVMGLDVGASIAPVTTVEDLLELRQLQARQFFFDTKLATGAVVRAAGTFARSSATPLRVRVPAPALDEHAGEIRAELARGSRSPSPEVPPFSPGAKLPFEGLKVADFSWIGVGPISTRCLADHGATVVKVESETRPDGLRSSGPFTDDEPGWNRSQFFGEFNTSKHDLVLDLKHPASAEVARRLVSWADVFVESFTPGAVARLGLDYASVCELNPKIVMLSTCLMGQTGPHNRMAGYGYHAGAIAGFYELTGWPDLPPVGPYQAYTDTVSPRFLIPTLLAALDHARRTGEGQHIDVAQLECGLQFLAPEILAFQTNGVMPTRSGNRGRDAAPQGAYPCAGDDQWCSIAVATDAQWRALCGALGADDWAVDPALAGADGRAARHDALDEGIASWTRTRTPREVMDAMQAVGVPAGAVSRSSDLLRDPQYVHRGFHHPIEHPEMGLVPYAGHSFRIEGYASGPRWHAPTLGQHSFEVLHELLGFGDDEIAELVAAGAVV
jgi:benzylsuccinate CoA-transferase BbsF subunit